VGGGRSRIVRIISGGQSGADRASLDAAIAAGLPYGGWCPAGGWAEDYPTPPGLLSDYPNLIPTDSADPAVRTKRNVRDSDATLIVREEHLESSGTDIAVLAALAAERPLLTTAGDVEQVRTWLETLGWGVTLNVGGPRESEQPGVYAATLVLLRDVLAG
jgi:hypothetical protein